MAAIRFGQHIIKSSAVFLQTELSFALVNRKPVVPGRILLRFSFLSAGTIFGLSFSSHLGSLWNTVYCAEQHSRFLLLLSNSLLFVKSGLTFALGRINRCLPSATLQKSFSALGLAESFAASRLKWPEDKFLPSRICRRHEKAKMPWIIVGCTLKTLFFALLQKEKNTFCLLILALDMQTEILHTFAWFP